MDISDEEERSSEEEKPKKKSSGGKGGAMRSSFKERAKEKSEETKKKVRERASSSCPEDEVSDKIKEKANKYALIRKSSKKRFKWNEDMPEVDDKDEQREIRHYAKEHLMPKVPMVTVKDRNGENIKCPIFPKETVVLEVMLPKDKWDDTDYEQFKYLDEQVKLKGFESGTRMYNGKKYTWHHHHDEGKMQLVENGIHSATQHSGGREIWAAERTSPFDNL